MDDVAVHKTRCITVNIITSDSIKFIFESSCRTEDVNFDEKNRKTKI